MLSGWLIYRQKDIKTNRSYIKWFIEEGEKQSVELTLIERERLSIGFENNIKAAFYDGKPVQLPDFAVVRTVEPFLHVHLESCGIPTLNSSTIAHMSHHKYLTYHYMSQLDIPILDSIFLTKADLKDDLPMSLPFVIKDGQGRSGQHVYLITTLADWLNVFEKLPEGDLIIQSAHVSLGKDVRVFVVGKEIIGAALRNNKTDFRANYTLGGQASTYHLTLDERLMIQKIIDAYDFDLVGIDFLVGHGGELYFNEIEDVVGSRILSATSSVNLLERYVSHIRNKLSEIINRK